MTAMTKDRNTARLQGNLRSGPVAAGAVIFAGALVMRNAAGFLVQGQATAGLVGVGRAEHRADNGGGGDGASNLTYQPGTFHYVNSGGVDAVTAADIGKPVYAVDDQTVANDNGGGTRSPAGIADGIDANGVWVRIDAALTNAS
ncbi:hypothetical protein [Phaeobacter inhibens]|uniref:hypothetical protein n=1 Tax=Phaeobacter inhibens TaxID=221822 RepID=UPI00076BB51A|nr:hypothetical protein [Phaeobacter inhibens]KXF92094.1 hypothetical protein AT574_03825 [Phaeobacter inhibens]WHP69929.1 hypothetical protein QMZ01_07075 [Phaeobacter inhibens]